MNKHDVAQLVAFLNNFHYSNLHNSFSNGGEINVDAIKPQQGIDVSPVDMSVNTNIKNENPSINSVNTSLNDGDESKSSNFNLQAAIGGASGLISDAIAQTNEVSQKAKAIKNGIRTNESIMDNNIGASNTDDLYNQLNNITSFNAIQKSDLLNSKGSYVGRALMNTASGAGAGMSAGGPWGALAGAGAGTLSSIFGSLAANRKAKRETKKINNLINENNIKQDLVTSNAVNNQRMNDSLFGNIAADGGPINMQYSGTNSPFGNRFDNGGINIKESNKGKFTALANTHGMTPLQMANHIFANKNNYSSTQIKRANFVRNAAKWHAEGGNLDSQFSDFRNGVTEYNVGGTHEENPNEGIQVGVDQQGTPNLVEQGEVNYNDYIFSNRLKVPKDFKKQYKLGNDKKAMTYADAAKKLQKESEERPLDPISKKGLNAVLKNLANSQEETRFKKQMQDPQFRQQAMQAMAQQETMQQPSEEEMIAMQQQAAQQPFAYGGNLYDNGSWLKGNNSATKSMFGQLYSNLNNTKATDWDINWRNIINKNDNIPTVEELSQNPEMWDFSDFPDKDDFKQSANSKIPYSTEVSDNSGFYRSKAVKDLYDKYLLNNPKAFSNWVSNLGGITEDYAREHFNEIRNGLQGFGSWTPSLRKYIDFNENSSSLQRNVDMINPSSEKTNNTNNTEINNINSLEGLPTWMRYAPAFAGIAGLFSRPDYSAANMLQAAVNRAAQYNPIRGSYIGDYQKYNPYDINYIANQIRQQGNTTLSQINNMSGYNRGTALASAIMSNYNAQQALGNAYLQAMKANDEQRLKVGEFNRGTNQFNAQVANQIAQFNAQQKAAANAQYLNGIAQVANMREKQQLLADQARSNAISSIGTSLGNIGRENFAANQQLGLLSSGYYGTFNPSIMSFVLKNNGINPRSKAYKTFMADYTRRYNEQNELDEKVKNAKKNAKKNKNNN